MQRAQVATITLAAIFGLLVGQPVIAADTPPAVGDIAADFELTALSGEKLRLSKVAERGPVVLIVLRGFPGYQCPVCNKQVGQYLEQADKFRTAGAQIIFVYPGPSKQLPQKAKEFLKDAELPGHIHLVTDPDYTFTNAYHLRWNAPNETAYPSTFIVQKDRKITFAKISKDHGGRTKPADVLGALGGK